MWFLDDTRSVTHCVTSHVLRGLSSLLIWEPDHLLRLCIYLEKIMSSYGFKALLYLPLH